jgi:hypothetical protein
MPLYGAFQAGSNPDLSKNLSDVQPGTSYVLLDGTEDFSEVFASVAFARGTQGSTDAGMSFSASGMPPGGSVNIEVANEDDGSLYTVVNSISADGNGNGSTIDIGRSAFYRVAPIDSGSSPAAGVRVRVQR